MEVVGLDTMIMIWGFRDPFPQAGAQELDLEQRIRARILIRELAEKKARIIIPTVMISELLIRVPEIDHGKFLATLESNFFCPPYDLIACSLAARLWIEHRDLPEEQRLERRVLKSDIMIVATAKVAGASHFYSHDARCRRLAEQAGLTAHDLPTHSEDLFIDAEVRRGGEKP